MIIIGYIKNTFKLLKFEVEKIDQLPLYVGLYAVKMGDDIGFTYANVRICNPAERGRGRSLELLVDSGAVYTIMRGDRLEELGIKPEGKRSFKMADGRVIERKFGITVAEYKEERTGTVVIFGEANDVEVFGVHALEGLGLELDPVTKELRPMTLLLF